MTGPSPGATVRARRSRRSALSTAATYLLLVLLAIIFIGPFVLLLSTSLKPQNQALFGFPPDLIPRPPVLDSFKEAWTTVPFGRYLWNSVVYELGVVPLYLVISILTAYPLGAMKFRGRTLMFYLFLSTMFLPTEVMLIPRFLVTSQLHLTNSFLGLILPAVLSGIGIFLLRQAFSGVPRELSEAAAIDGCGSLRVLWHVMIPATRPTLAVLAILGFISVWNSFIWPLIVLTDMNKYPVALGLTFLSGVAGNDVRGLTAGAVIAIVPMIIFFIVLQRRILDSMAGAVKG